jgi:MOSC domain-containing protein YiiM
LPADAVCIGDRYQIGSALFEVTQPRVTCYRIGIRMNEPRRRWTTQIVDG